MHTEKILSEKLYQLRKQSQLSQEEFAEKLGVSRQAVSKWECGESLPDTENLIAISKLYGVSLDELVGNTPTEQSEISAQTSSTTVELSPEENENDSGLDNKENENSEHEDDLSEEDEDDEEKQLEQLSGKKKKILRVLLALPYPILITIAYLLWGFLAEDGWEVGWTLYLTVPVYYTILDCIRTKRLSHFAYPVLVAFIYLFIGMKWGFWHPHWIMFITVPIYYPIVEAIQKK